MSALDLGQMIKKVERLLSVHYRALDSLISAMTWIDQYCKKNGIPLPNYDTIYQLIREGNKELESLEDPPLSDERKQGYDSDKEVTEPLLLLHRY